MKKIMILVIDDEEDFCYFVKAGLKLLGGYEVITETSSKKGIKAARKQKPDLILLDIIMPGMDGFEVLKRLKRNIKTMHIPVVMLTAKDEDVFKIKASGLYCDDYIVKPFEIDKLNSRIKKVLSLRKLI